MDGPVAAPIPTLLKWASQVPAEAGQFVPVSRPAFPWSPVPRQIRESPDARVVGGGEPQPWKSCTGTPPRPTLRS